jgi:hypothetical protein
MLVLILGEGEQMGDERPKRDAAYYREYRARKAAENPEWAAEQRRKNNEYMKRYYVENAEYREATKARVKAQQAAAKAADPEAFLKMKAAHTAAYRERHGERYKEMKAVHARDARTRAREFVVNLKSTTPCADCGQMFPHNPERMDFDHLSDKETTIAKLVASGAAPRRLMVEISKCEIVCGNCHRTRTVTRLRQGGTGMEEAI